MPNYTPMMEQYFAIKKHYPHCLMLFRMGDFYELFFEDATIAAKELDITLTGRECGQTERAPMCGVPHHSVDGYLARLVEKGYHVAICEQVEDPKQTKGIVRREVVRVVTPGTITDPGLLDESRHNYIMCLYQDAKGYGCAMADITTGLFLTTSFRADEADKLVDELARLNPAEVIVNEGFAHKITVQNIAGVKPAVVAAWTFAPANAFKCLTSHFKVMHLEGFGLKQNTPAVFAAGALLEYLSETQKHALMQITAIKAYSLGTHMALDMPSRRNLELTASMHSNNKKHSLLGVLDRTETAMGARLLRTWVEQPLTEPVEINRRLDAVEELKNDPLLRGELKESLHTVHDLERLMTRLASNTAGGRDLAALRASFKYLPSIAALTAQLHSSLNTEIYRTFDDLSDLYERIETVLVDEPPFGVREGGLIKPGVHAELDELLRIKSSGTGWLAELEAREREQTGVKNLKIRYNKIFGYYIEITNSHIHLAPERYIRRQTLANCERFITEELKRLEETILTADEKLADLEFTLFDALRREILEQIARIQFTAYSLATLDALQSLADAADRNHYCKPVVDEQKRIHIKNGRHPVIERMTEYAFVPNDTELDGDNNRLAIITGPNMAGKSTYMRQTALIVLMAQIGSFVPADSAHIGVTDRIFTRVGASDDLATGQSTFMVEMTEVANILHNATANSLILLDEIGRGTSTFDGLSIAWSVLEYIADTRVIGAKTLFSTHYHELTELEGQVEGVVNYSFAVQEMGDDIIFLRKIMRGGTDHSFGIHVARLAGLPPVVLNRAREVLAALNAADIARSTDVEAEAYENEPASDENLPINKMSVKDRTARNIASALQDLDVDRVTPLEAITELSRLKEMLHIESVGDAIEID